MVKTRVFWYVTPRGILVNTPMFQEYLLSSSGYMRERELTYPENGPSTFLSDIGTLPNYTVSHPKRQQPSQPPAEEP